MMGMGPMGMGPMGMMGRGPPMGPGMGPGAMVPFVGGQMTNRPGGQ